MRYIDADALIEMCKRQIECEWNTIAAPGSWADAFQDFSDLVEQTPTADVVPRRKFAKGLLLDLKAAVTNKATYPDCKADYAYINLKVFNALVQEFIKKYEEGKDES